MKPKRRKPPKRAQRMILERQDQECQCGCGEPVGELGGDIPTEYQHTPALALREVAPDGKDWIPSQHDIRYLFAMVPAHHARETNHPRGPHTSLGSDKHAIAKVRRLRGENKPKVHRRIKSRSFGVAPEGYKHDWKSGRLIKT